MRLKKYKVYQTDEDYFWFTSTGHMGEVIKVVIFEDVQQPGVDRYNLAMGDYDPIAGKAEYEELTGNNDARTVFATIADIVDHYTEQYPGRQIFVKGNTKKKERLYSVMISNYIANISVDFNVWGVDIDQSPVPFEIGKVYPGILVKRK